MKILSWNCWGLGNPQAVRSLCCLVKDKKPTLVFLMETKVSRRKARFLPHKLGFENMFVVDNQGKSGGLILLWTSVSSVEIQNFSCRHINAIIKLRSGATSWKFSGFYGHPDASKRMQAWSLLRHLSNLDPVPWLCSGDFNEITSMGEMSSSSI
jgi:exonuclease III